MLSIYKREIKAYFHGTWGYLYLAMFFLMCGYFFVVNNVIGGSGDITGVISGVYICANLLIPFLTMDTLLTQGGYGIEYTMYAAPIHVVLGKFFAILTLSAIGILGLVFYHFLLSIFCEQSLKLLFFNQISMLLISASCISIGMFASAISYRRTQALITSYTLLLMLFLLDRSLDSVLQISQLRLVSALSIFSGYSNFEAGIFSPTDVLVMIAFSMILLGISASMINRRKERGI